MKDSPGFNTSESNSPSSEVTVCGLLPLFTHITVSPGWMATSGGSKSKSSISTDHIFGVVDCPIMSWGCCCAPASGTTTSRAKKERATKHNRRLIDTTSSCATSFPAILRSLPTQQCPQLRRLSTVTSKLSSHSYKRSARKPTSREELPLFTNCREGSFSETRLRVNSGASFSAAGPWLLKKFAPNLNIL